MEIPFSKLNSPTFVQLPFCVHACEFFQSEVSPVSDTQNDPAFMSSMEPLLSQRHISIPFNRCTAAMSI